MEHLIIQQLNSDDLAKEAAEYIFASLNESGFFTAQKSFLLLSGGSCVDVAVRLAALIPDDVHLANTTIGLADERWVQVGSADSNEQQLRDKGALSIFEEKGAQFISMLDGNDPTTPSDKIDQRYKDLLSENVSVALLAGMGADGHTLGILPENNQTTFLEKFSAEKLVTYYELHPLQDNPFKKRITLTLTGASRIPQIYIFATGETKKEALTHLLKKDATVNQAPVLGLYLSEQPPTLLTDVLL